MKRGHKLSLRHYFKQRTFAPPANCQFSDGTLKLYDITGLLGDIPVFQRIIDDPELFRRIHVSRDKCAVIWNDDMDLAAEEIYSHGKTINI